MDLLNLKPNIEILSDFMTGCNNLNKIQIRPNIINIIRNNISNFNETMLEIINTDIDNNNEIILDIISNKIDNEVIYNYY